MGDLGHHLGPKGSRRSPASMAATTTAIGIVFPAIVIIIIVGLLWAPSGAAAAADLMSDGDALLAFLRGLDSYNQKVLNNWSNSSSPCTWVGVTCNKDGDRIETLRLPSSGLHGSITPSTLGLISSLTVLSLRSNRLSGPIPADLTTPTRLKKLFLQHNLLTGPIPAFNSSLTPSLNAIDLSFNSLTDQIPTSFSTLTLSILLLQNNSLSGSIPDGIDTISLMQFNVSNNKLSGAVPPGLRTFPGTSFGGNNGLCGPPTGNGQCETEAPAPTAVAASSDEGNGKVLSKLDLLLIVLASVMCALLLLSCCLIVKLVQKQKKLERGGKADRGFEGEFKKGGEDEKAKKKKRRKSKKKSRGDKDETQGEEEEEEEGEGREGEEEEEVYTNDSVNKMVFFGSEQQGRFDLEDLLRASAEVLGKGSYGTVYKAVLEDGHTLVVKRLKHVSVGRKEFEQHMDAVGRLRHAHLLPLRAYYFSKEEKLLVYDYLPLGTLSNALSGSPKTELDWDTRLKVAVATAKGLAHIHAVGPKVAHGAVNASNVMLDETGKGAYLADYGICGLFSSNVGAARMAGYKAPELAGGVSHGATQKADVYALGVVLLELLTGKAAGRTAAEEGMELPRWVHAVVREEWTAEVFDPDLLRLSSTVEEELVQLLHLSLACVSPYPDKRPSAAEVIEGLLQIRPAARTSSPTPSPSPPPSSLSSSSPQQLAPPPPPPLTSSDVPP